MHYKDKNLQIDIRCHTVFMNDQKIESERIYGTKISNRTSWLGILSRGDLS